MTQVSHSDAIKLAMLELSNAGCMVARRDVGLFYDKRDNARFIGIVGEADVQAVAPGGRAVAVEIKTGNARRTEQQKRWGARFTQLGGVYCVAWWNETQDGVETIRDALRLAGLAT